MASRICKLTAPTAPTALPKLRTRLIPKKNTQMMLKRGAQRRRESRISIEADQTCCHFQRYLDVECVEYTPASLVIKGRLSFLMVLTGSTKRSYFQLLFVEVLLLRFFGAFSIVVCIEDAPSVANKVESLRPKDTMGSCTDLENRRSTFDNIGFTTNVMTQCEFNDNQLIGQPKTWYDEVAKAEEKRRKIYLQKRFDDAK